MNKIKFIYLLYIVLSIITVSCSKSQSYSELLREEEHATNWYLAGKNVEMNVPKDSIFQYGKDAPFYRMDEDGYIYMQVVNPGNQNNQNNKAKQNEQIYYRYTRWNLLDMYHGIEAIPEGNAVDMSLAPTSFRFDNLSAESSYMSGAAIQVPLKYLPIGCEVNLIIRSYYGFQIDKANCIPFLVNVRYYRAAMQ